MSRATASADLSAPASATGGTVRAIIETTKPRITRLVTLTSAMGFALALLGSGERPAFGATVLTALAAVLGTALSASGANTINQWWERERDARMPRTAGRPIPTSRVEPGVALAWGVVLGVLGVVVLLFGAGVVPATIAAATILLYVFIYTPMKVRSAWCTVIGAVPGALPPVIGWSAAAGGDDFAAAIAPGALSLFALMTVWQLPHFYAIAWMYRDDYAAGAYRVLPRGDADGKTLALWMALAAGLLVPVSVWPAFAMSADVATVYLAITVLSSVAYFAMTVRFARDRSRDRARAVFFASIVHLPMLLVALVAESTLRAAL